MFNIISHNQKMTFNSSPLIAFEKKFEPLGKDFIGKYNAILIKIEGKVFAIENATIITLGDIIDIVTTKKIQETQQIKTEDTKKLKKIKKMVKVLESKFQFGVSHKELNLMYDAQDALAKYKLLVKNKLEIKGGENV